MLVVGGGVRPPTMGDEVVVVVIGPMVLLTRTLCCVFEKSIVAKVGGAKGVLSEIN